MKIAQIYENLSYKFGGAPKFVLLLSEGLSRNNIIDIITIKSIKLRKRKNIYYYNYPEWLGIINSKLILHFKKYNYDIVQVHGYYSFIPINIVIAKILYNFPLFFFTHYHRIGKSNKLVRILFDNIFGRITLKFSDVIFVHTQIEKEYILQLGIKEEKIRIIPSILDPILFKKFNKINFQKKYNIKNKKILLFIGRLDTNKGLFFLLKTYHLLKNKRDDICLFIVGKDVGLRYKIKKYIRKKHIKDVIITGPISNDLKLSILSNAYLLVLPSAYEAFGLVLIEAMKAKIPVIGTNRGGIPYVLQNGKYGLLVKYGDINSLLFSIEQLLNNNNLREKYIQKGFNYSKKFSQIKISNKIENEYYSFLLKSFYNKIN